MEIDVNSDEETILLYVAENAFNRAMITSVLEAVRAFSVERDRISDEWKALELIKNRRERLVEIFRNLSPLSKDNYLSKALAFLIALGISLETTPKSLQKITASTLLIFIIALFALEVLSRIAEFLVGKYYENKLPTQRTEKWKKESMEIYKTIISGFIEEAIENYKQFLPEVETINGYKIKEGAELKQLKDFLIKNHFYLYKERREGTVPLRTNLELQ